MDLSKFETRKGADTGAIVELLLPDGSKAIQDDGNPVSITVAGSDSAVFKRTAQTQADRWRKAGVRRAVTMDSVEQDVAELLAACTLSWSGIEDGGKPLECNADNAKRIYLDFPDIREQVNAFIGQRANFLKA